MPRVPRARFAMPTLHGCGPWHCCGSGRRASGSDKDQIEIALTHASVIAQARFAGVVLGCLPRRFALRGGRFIEDLKQLPRGVFARECSSPVRLPVTEASCIGVFAA
jgi:hypothetical protein